MKWNKLKKKKGVGQNVGLVQQAEQERPVERDGQAHSYEPVVRGLQEQVRRKRQRRRAHTVRVFERHSMQFHSLYFCISAKLKKRPIPKVDCKEMLTLKNALRSSATIVHCPPQKTSRHILVDHFDFTSSGQSAIRGRDCRFLFAESAAKLT